MALATATPMEQSGGFKQKSIAFFSKVTQFLTWPFLFVIFRLCFRLRIHGGEHFRNARKPFIIVANHISWYDSFFFRLALGFWTSHLPLRFMAVTHFKNSLLNALRAIGLVPCIYALFGVFTVTQGEGIEKGLREARHILRHGENIVMYAEGGVHTGEDVAPFKKGTAVLALETGVPVIPVAFRLERRIGLRRGFSVSVGMPMILAAGVGAELATLNLHEAVFKLYQSLNHA